MADVPGVFEALVDELFGLVHGIGHEHALGNVGGEGGAEGAAGTVVFGDGQAREHEFGEFAFVAEDVDDVVTAEVAAFGDAGDIEFFGDDAGGFAEVFEGADGEAGEDFGFVEVGGDDAGEGEELGGEGADGVAVHEAGAVAGDHAGVDDEGGDAADGVGFAGDFDEFAGGEHAGFGGGDGESVADGHDLLHENGGGHGMDFAEFAGGLGGDGGDGAGAVDFEEGEGFEVGLHPGTGSAVGTGDGEDDGDVGVGKIESGHKCLVA